MAPQEPGGPAASAWVPPEKALTTLGWLKYIEDPSFAHMEWHYLKFLKENLTAYWYIIQFGTDKETLDRWYLIFKVLELDRKAQLDLMLLAHSGLLGRGYANQVLWELMSNWALDANYEDLSHKVTSMVSWARKDIDRPPVWHEDAAWWTWKCYEEPQRKIVPWLPSSKPPQKWYLMTGPNGEPLPPPCCWGTLP